ncbi:MAG: rod shape-determining protein MreD [Ignavibacteria bacterium]|nr:rod shape-determining protein MreD [Ignavibacteria bacterium]MCU7503979.1 rod shape-determining protein MreD [Ignavibacteria bacterium]MCU7515351.1 rod shape-determining protein MreD [Ignavibacteria bacterium]
MRADYFIAILLMIPLTILQLTVIPFLSYNQIAPDLLLILLVYYTLKMGQMHGTILGFIFGLFFDLVSGGILGSAMFSKTLSGFLTGYFYNDNKVELNIHTFMFLFIVLVIGTVDSVTSSFFGSAETSSNIITLILMQGLFPAMYSSVLSLPMVIFHSRKIFA